MEPVLHRNLPFAPWMDPVASRLPGTRAADPDDWVRVDEAHAGQMALRDALIATRPGDVLACLPGAVDAARETLDRALDRLSRDPGHEVSAATVLRPDRIRVDIDRDRPMATLGRLVQEDLCLLMKPADAAEHMLAAAALCFPASWTLAEKIGRPMLRIHRPVSEYSGVAPRVERMLSNLRPGRPVWRANAHLYDSPELFAPKREADPVRDRRRAPFLRSEFQMLSRLPETGAVLFSIHTYMLPVSALAPEARAALAARERLSDG